ncbi:uncharacterized protein [Solanum lycopersicum]|uniref:uncharacterized protein n=1 Tax=Solanum lycopersicum TaxID=4081 RepID=UPI003747FCC9
MGEDPQEFLDGVYKVLSAMGVISREKEELASYKIREVSQVWYTQWKDNSSVESGPIECKEFKEAFLGKYFPRERRQVKVDEFINLKQGNMSVEEYSLMFSMLSRYAPSLVYNPREEMIEKYKLCRISRNLKRSGTSDQSQPRFKRKVATQEEPRGDKVKIEKGGGSQVGKPTCGTCGKRCNGECLLDTGSCFGFGKYGHKVRDCPNRDGKKVAPNILEDDAPKKRGFYALGTRGEKLD